MRPGKTGATPPSHRMFPALLDTNAIASSASPHSKRESALAVKDGHRVGPPHLLFLRGCLKSLIEGRFGLA
jgi:hypothetical protein